MNRLTNPDVPTVHPTYTTPAPDLRTFADFDDNFHKTLRTELAAVKLRLDEYERPAYCPKCLGPMTEFAHQIAAYLFDTGRLKEKVTVIEVAQVIDARPWNDPISSN